MKKVLSAFTLAEVMLAVAVIGILAAVTVPAVTTKFQKDSMTMALKKTYNELEHNLTLLQSENYYKKGVSNSKLTSEEGVESFIRDSFAVSADCDANAEFSFSEYGGCFPRDMHRNIDGDSSKSISEINAKFYLLKSGAVLGILPYNALSGYAEVYIDVNGADKPNIGGRDMFTLRIYDDYSVDDISPAEIQNGTARHSDSDCKNQEFGFGCFSRIIENDWKMKY